MELSWLILPTGRALSARVDSPADGMVRGGVLFVPSAAREAVVSSRAQRAFALRAADHGFLCLTFSLTGDGDSSPLIDPDVAAVWRADVSAALAELRRRLPSGLPVHCVALRLGCCLVPSTRPDLGMTVLWEPVSGKSFLRHHLAIRKLAIPNAPRVGSAEISGATYTLDQALHIRLLDFPKPADSAIVHRIESNRDIATRIAISSPHDARIPVEAIEEILTLLPGGNPSPFVAVEGTSTHLIAAENPAADVLETHVQVGPHHLSGILSTGATPPRGAAIFMAMGAELKSGPGNLWVTLGTQIAQQGIACLRVDRRLLGDSLDPSQLGEPRPYTEEAVDDICDAVDFLVDRFNVPVTVVGVCAGGWLALKAAARRSIESVIAVNVVHWNPDPSVYDEAFYTDFYQQGGAPLPGQSEHDEEPASGLTLAFRTRWTEMRHRAAIQFPRLRAWVRSDRLTEKPGSLLALVPSHTSVELLMGPWEYSRFEAQGGVTSADHLRRRGQDLTVTSVQEIDHSVLSDAGEIAVASHILRHFTDTHTSSPIHLNSAPRSQRRDKSRRCSTSSQIRIMSDTMRSALKPSTHRA